jgi:tRNA nucleotidyltransferase (CCA-adding enzyme)
MVRWHMQMLFIVKGWQHFTDIPGMAAEVSLREIALLGFCDRLGRGNLTQEKRQQELSNVQAFLEKCNEFLNDRDLHMPAASMAHPPLTMDMLDQ